MLERTLSRLRSWADTGTTTLRRKGLDRLLLLAIRQTSYTVQLHRRIGAAPPPIATTIPPATTTGVVTLLRLLRRRYPQKYTDADPYRLLWVNPTDIEYVSSPSKRRGWVVAGTWDRQTRRFADRPIPKAIFQHFVDGVPWADTPLATVCESATERRRRSARIERLYDRIEREGYRSQRELLTVDPEAAWDGLNDAMHPALNEVTIDIGRDGRLLWSMGGQHRLAIAQVLESDRIPVHVMRRHYEWQQIREQARSGDTVPDAARTHPDMTDLIDAG